MRADNECWCLAQSWSRGQVKVRIGAFATHSWRSRRNGAASGYRKLQTTKGVSSQVAYPDLDMFEIHFHEFDLRQREPLRATQSVRFGRAPEGMGEGTSRDLGKPRAA
jgi:hypothetical protein